MPEGDTVWRTAAALDQALSGQHADRASTSGCPTLATVDLTGQMVDETVARGKHLLTRIGDDHTLHTHLKMEGAWHLYRHASRGGAGRAHEARVVLRTPRTGTRSASRSAWSSCWPATTSTPWSATSGPDLLGPDWDADEASRRLLADPDRPLGEALLDQRNLAGIGNLYMSETLFLSGVSPLTP